MTGFPPIFLMSGFVGIINLDRSPIDGALLQQMTEFITYRGPDAQQIWMDGAVGFGHSMLRTTAESLNEQQPCTLEGEIWITADARVDGRLELIEKLTSMGCNGVETATDAQLILHAYQVWGENCCQYLLGDFAFAIWDGQEQRLFCARDHFGVKPFYYALVGKYLVFGNTLDCLRLHPAVSDRLNDLAIADFLLFGCNQELDTTAFADIRRLGPAHTLIWSESGLNLKRYWTLPVDGYIRYQRSEDYVEHFKALMEVAVSDRLRTDRVAVSMSGGLDSTTIAATAVQLRRKQSLSLDISAFTGVYDRLFPDPERYYAGLVAQALGIPINYLVADDYNLFERWEQPELRRPEPADVSLLAMGVDRLQRIALHSRVLLDGNGGDPVLYCWGVYFYAVHLLKHLQFGNLLRDFGQYILSHRRLPPPGLRSRLKQWLGIRPPLPPYPSWIDQELCDRLNLSQRWEKINCEQQLLHPIRPEAYQQLSASMWPYLFESNNPGVTGFPVEVRYPFFDLRLVNYLLAIPPMPWCLHKELVRVAMKGSLPEQVRLRPKTPLAGDPIGILLQQFQSQPIKPCEPTPVLAKYINRDVVPSVAQMDRSFIDCWLNLRPLNLNCWLRHLKPANRKLVKEDYHALK